MDYAAKPKEMKRPVNWGQMVGIVSGILIPVLMWLNGLSNKVATLDEKTSTQATQMYNNQLSNDKKLDEIKQGQREQGNTLVDIRVMLENKQNRK
jgi:hypothetical protein